MFGRRRSSKSLAADASVIGEFKAKYLGSVTVEQAVPKDDDMVPDAIDRCLDQNLPPLKVFIRVRVTDVQVINRFTGDAVQNTAITEVTYTNVDASNANRFVYITSKGGLRSLHLFSMKYDAIVLPTAFGKAFEHTAAELKRAKDPSSPSKEGGESAIGEMIRLAREQRSLKKSSATTIGRPLDAFFLGSTPATKAVGEEVVKASWEKLKLEVCPHCAPTLLAPPAITHALRI